MMGMECHFNVYYITHTHTQTHTTEFCLHQTDSKDTGNCSLPLTAELVAMPIELLVQLSGGLGGDGG